MLTFECHLEPVISNHILIASRKTGNSRISGFKFANYSSNKILIYFTKNNEGTLDIKN